MARIKTSALISDISGRVNGSVFQRSQGGLILRTERAHINRRTSEQLILRFGMQAVQQAWSQLSSTDIANWTAYAVARNKAQHKNAGIALSGQALFIAENMLRFRMDGNGTSLSPVIMTTPVIAPPADQISIVYVKDVTGNMTVQLDRAINGTNDFLVLKMSRPLSASQQSQYNKLLVIPFTQSTNDHWNIESAYIALYGRKPVTDEYVNTEITFAIKANNGVSLPVRQRLLYNPP